MPSLATVPLARAYAQVLLAFLSDCARIEPGMERPVTVVEVGSGTGRFAWLVLDALDELVQRRARGGLPRVRWVLTEPDPGHFEDWRHHEQLGPLFEAGRLDAAVFDPSRDDALCLLQSGDRLDGSTYGPPLAFVLNGVLGTLAQDVLTARDGALTEWYAPDEVVDPVERYPDLPQLHGWLADASATDGQVRVPVGAVRTLANLDALSGNHHAVLAGDRSDLQSVQRAAEDAGAKGVRGGGGMAQLSTLTLTRGPGLAGTLQAAWHWLVDHDPALSHRLRWELAEQTKSPRVAAGLVADAAGDPDLFGVLAQTMVQGVAQLGDPDLVRVGDALHRVHRCSFQGDGRPDIPYAVGRIALLLGDDALAARAFKRSLHWFGARRQTIRPGL